jgi:hypothetical protein
MGPSFFLDVLRDWFREDHPVMPIIVAALAAVLMVVVLIWLPGIP